MWGFAQARPNNQGGNCGLDPDTKLIIFHADQSSTSQLSIRTTESHQPSIQPLGGTSSIDMVDSSIQQQFQFGQPTTTETTKTKNRGYNWNSGQGMNFSNFNNPISSTNPPLFSGNTNAPSNISKRVIRKTTRRKKT